jgi:protein-disulfide isomerase
MNRQRLLTLLALAFLFLGATTFYFIQIAHESKTRFRAGYPIPTNLLPEDLLAPEQKIPNGPPTAPDIRSSDPLIWGSASSAVTVIVFGDFQSDASQQEAIAISDALKTIGGSQNIRVIWRDFPLYTEHSKAVMLATAARCAGAERKFRGMHDLLFYEGKTFDEAEIMRFVRKLGLNERDFKVCMHDPAIPFRISKDVEEAQMHGITGVPTLFVNGFPFIGFVDADSLAMVFRRNLNLSTGTSE